MNGLLVPVGDAAALAAAIDRFFADDEPRATRLRARAASSVAGLQRRASARRRSSEMLEEARRVKPRVLFVARTRYALPLSETLQRRFDALSEVLDWRQLGTSATGQRGRRRPLHARRRASHSAPRRGGVLRRAAVPGRRRDPLVPSRRADRPGGARTRRLRSLGRRLARSRASRSSSTSTATGGTTRASTAHRCGGF